MYVYIVKRLLVAIPTILIISVFVFSLQKLLPGDPVLVMAGEDRDPQTLEYLRERYRLNDPIPYQYAAWLGSAVQGDLGISLRTNQPVLHLIAQKLPATLQLAVMAIVIAVLIGVPMGILAATRKNTALDYIANIVALSGLSIPNFWLGIMLILLVSVKLGWLPASGYESIFDDPVRSLRTMIMPAFVLGNALAATLMRHTRSSMLSVLNSDYIRTARAKGLPENRIVTKHALRAALLPLVSYLGPACAGLLTGSLVVEKIFNLPGLGKFFVISALQRDYTVVMGMVIIYAALILFLNLIADLLYAALDPRVRLS
jgi:peptide/nickel transport system permease protein